jgi:ribosomal protein S18 acetylase RimI-like enzyme
MGVQSVYELEVARTRAEVSALREVWHASELNADLDFYLTVIEARREVLRPHVVVLKKDDRTHSILAGRIERKEFVVRLGYWKVVLPSVRWLTIVHGGVVGDASEDSVSRLVSLVVASLRDEEVDLACFDFLDRDSPIFRAVSKAGAVWRRGYFPDWANHWTARVPRSYRELLALRPAGVQKQLKRYRKRLVKLVGDQMTIARREHPAEVEMILADCETIARKTYQRGLQVGFVDSNETRLLMTLSAHRGWLRSYILYIGQRPCAFWNDFLYQRTFQSWNIGFDPDFRDLRLGHFLREHVLEELCETQGADTVDFGFGDALYKRECGDQGSLRGLSLCVCSNATRGATERGHDLYGGNVARCSVGAAQSRPEAMEAPLDPSGSDGKVKGTIRRHGLIRSVVGLRWSAAPGACFCDWVLADGRGHFGC